MSNLLKINNIEKINGNLVKVHFESNFQLTKLSAQCSLDNINWSNNILLQGLTSPQLVNLPISNSCYVRLNDNDYVPPPPPDLMLINNNDKLLINATDILEI